MGVAGCSFPIHGDSGTLKLQGNTVFCVSVIAVVCFSVSCVYVLVCVHGSMDVCGWA